MASHRFDLEGIAEVVELGKEGPKIKKEDSGNAIGIRNQADDAYLPLRAGDASGDNDVITKKYFETHSALSVTGQIDGGSPPAAGTTGRVFIVTTAGGGYGLNELYRDDGTNWVQITVTDGMRITITQDLTGGTIEFWGDHVYLWDEGSSTWLDVGRVSGRKAVRHQEVSIGWADAGDSNIGDPLPAGSYLTEVKVNVTQVFDGTNPTLIVGDAVDADRHMEATHVNLKKVGIYTVDRMYLYGAETQVLANFAVGGTPGSGQCVVMITIALP